MIIIRIFVISIVIIIVVFINVLLLLLLLLLLIIITIIIIHSEEKVQRVVILNCICLDNFSRFIGEPVIDIFGSHSNGFLDFDIIYK